MTRWQQFVGGLLGVALLVGLPVWARAANSPRRGAWVVTPWTTEWIAGVSTPAEALKDAGVRLEDGARVVVNGQPWKPTRPLPADGWAVVQVQQPVEVAVTVDGAPLTLTTTAPTLAAALAEGGVTLREGDLVAPDPWIPPVSAPQVLLQRATRLTVQVGEHAFPLTTAAKTVGEALAEANLAPQGLEITVPPDGKVLSPKTERVVLHRVWEKVVLRQLPVAFTSKTEARDDLPLDTIKVVQEGQYGLQVQRTRVRYEDGEEVGRVVDDTWLARPPKPRIVGYGTKITLQTLQTPDGPVTCWRVLRVYATSYSPCRLGVDHCSHTTFSGATLRKGVVAVKRSWYHYMAGQKVYIPGYGFGIIGDIGGGIPGRYWIDLGYTDEDYQSWHQWTTLCFVAPPPPPNQIPWILP